MNPPYDPGNPRPIRTVLDALRPRLALDDFDAAIFAIEAVATDLGYGDIRPLRGSVAWIDKLREDGKRIALLASGDRGAEAVELAGIGDRFDVVLSGARTVATIARALDELETEAQRTLAIDVVGFGITAAHDAGLPFAIAVAHDGAGAEQLRRSGADMVVADLLELLAPTS